MFFITRKFKNNHLKYLKELSTTNLIWCKDPRDATLYKEVEAQNIITHIKDYLQITDPVSMLKEPVIETIDIDARNLNLVKNMIRRIIPAYQSNGNTWDEYYQNIILPDLTEKEIQYLKDFSAEQ